MTSQELQYRRDVLGHWKAYQLRTNIWKVEAGHLTSQDQFTAVTGRQEGAKVHDQFISLYQSIPVYLYTIYQSIHGHLTVRGAGFGPTLRRYLHGQLINHAGSPTRLACTMYMSADHSIEYRDQKT
jgi:hypothetical protein